MMSSAAIASELSAVCCIEPGRLEPQTLLMIKSLRTFGGKFAQIPILAVVGRRAPPLRSRVLEELDRLNVTIVKASRQNNPAPWLNYANKIAAVTIADKVASTPQLIWLDSDLLFFSQPETFLLGPGQDFAASCIATHPTVFRGCELYVPYCERLCELLGARFDEIPWVTGNDGLGERKASLSSGIFTWRRGTGFAEAYRAGFETLLRSRLAQPTGIFFVADQVILAPIITRLKMAWKEYDLEDQLIVLRGRIEADSAMGSLGTARVLHYSNSLSPPYRQNVLNDLEISQPDFHQWLTEQEESLALGTPRAKDRITANILRIWRGLRYRIYAKRVRKAPAGH